MKFLVPLLLGLGLQTPATAQIADRLVFTLDKPNELLATLFDAKQLLQSGEAVWKPAHYAERLDARVSDDGYFHTFLDTILYFKKEGIERAVVVFSTVRFAKGQPEACAGCDALMSAALLVQTTQGDWYVEQFARHFTACAQPDGKALSGIRQFGPQEWCLSLTTDQLQGDAFRTLTGYYNLETLQRVYHLREHEDNDVEDNMPEEKVYQFDKSIHFLTALDTQTGWWDFEIVTRGSILDPDLKRAVTANKVERYTFDPETNAYMRICP